MGGVSALGERKVRSYPRSGNVISALDSCDELFKLTLQVVKENGEVIAVQVRLEQDEYGVACT